MLVKPLSVTKVQNYIEFCNVFMLPVKFNGEKTDKELIEDAISKNSVFWHYWVVTYVPEGNGYFILTEIESRN
jgi:hypothetical protein